MAVKNFISQLNVKFKAVNKKNVPEDTLKSTNLRMNADLEQFASMAMLRSQQLMKIRKLSNDILILKPEISNQKKENYQIVNMLAKVHLQELDYLKQKNNTLTKNIEELDKRLASQDIDLSNNQKIKKKNYI